MVPSLEEMFLTLDGNSRGYIEASDLKFAPAALLGVVRGDLVWLTLDEPVRQARLMGRGMTRADRETLDPVFRDAVMAVAQGQRGKTAVDLSTSMSTAGHRQVVAHAWLWS